MGAEKYIETCAAAVCQQIDDHLRNKNVDEIIDISFVQRSGNIGFQTFQRFYFDKSAVSRKDYFNVFRSRYSLQGVDGAYLEMLNTNKEEIFKRIHDGDIHGVYRQFFYKQEVAHGVGKTRHKSFGSFFTKLCHTVEPELYTPMDNPMRDHFGLQDESFPIAMLIVSDAFAKWCGKNKFKVKAIKDGLAEAINSDLRVGINIESIQLTNMKVMDMIYWSVANTPKIDDTSLHTG